MNEIEKMLDDLMTKHPNHAIKIDSIGYEEVKEHKGSINITNIVIKPIIKGIQLIPMNDKMEAILHP